MQDKVNFFPTDEMAILGLNWPEVDGICYIYKKYLHERSFDAHYSINKVHEILNKHPNKKIAIIIQPHNNPYFLYELSQQYSSAKIKIIADKIYLSDIVILETLGFTDVTTFDDSIKSRGLSLMFSREHSLYKIGQYSEPLFLKFINSRIINKLRDYGLTIRQQCILSLAVKGVSNEYIAFLLRISNKTVSAHKINALNKLPYGNHRYALTKGLQAQYSKPIN